MFFWILIVLLLVYAGAVWKVSVDTKVGIFAKKQSWQNLHVFITGGSKGLGREIAAQVLKLGAFVTILARNEKELQKTWEEILKEIPEKSENILAISGDVTKFSALQEDIKKAEAKFGPIQVGFMNAGTSLPGYFLSTPIEDMEKEMQLNYCGTLYTAKALVEAMVKNNVAGHLVFISSTTGLFNFIGYGSYGASKFAIRGLYEGLRNELLGFNIGCSIYFPATMKTEGYEIEERRKPKEARDIEGNVTPMEAKDCAAALIQDVQRAKSYITGDFMTDLIRSGTHSFFVPRTLVQGLVDICLAPFLILFSPLIRWLVADLPAFQYVVNRKR